MNLPEIENPDAWARTNKYRLTPMKSFSGTNWFVYFNGILVGTLREKLASAPKVWTFFAALNDDEETLMKESKGLGGGLDDFSFSGDQEVSTSALSFGLPAIDLTGQSNTKSLRLGANVSGTGYAETISDCNFWLPFAAEQYQLSKKLCDYVLVPIPAMFSQLPNTNGDSLKLEEMVRFDPFMGRQMYKTFQGKPTYEEHANNDISKAKGVILDAFIRKINRFGNGKVYKLVLLLAYDRTKDPELAESILSRSSNAYSVGFSYNAYECSVCGKRVGAGYGKQPCSHTRMKMRTYKTPEGKLAYRHCLNARGYECSAVKTPAFVIAIGPTVMDPRAVF